MSQAVYVVSAQRTPIGAFQGTLSSLPAPQLGAAAIKSALEKAALKSEFIDECIMGHVLTAGTGQAPARQAALSAGLSPSTPCLTINKVCGSGLKAIMLGMDSIRLGQSEIVIAGGQENMSLAPHLLMESRNGYRLGHVQTLDSLLQDGLWDPYHHWHMGQAAELCASEHKISREEQDKFAIESYEWAQRAQKSGTFNDEIVPVKIEGKKETVIVEKDEEPANARFDKMPGLRPAFEKQGTITAANASKINDGGAAVVLASETAVKKHQLKPIARIINHASFAQEPKWFTTAPVGAMKKSLHLAGLKAQDIGLWEINEAFSVVTLVAMKELGLNRQKVNVNGGAVALGHPIGASGARIFTTLVHALKKQNQSFGIASLCIGGGEAVSVLVERI